MGNRLTEITDIAPLVVFPAARSTSCLRCISPASASFIRATRRASWARFVILDAAGAWRAARCVSTAFNPARWNPFVTNLSGFGAYRIQFENTFPSYCTLLMKSPVAGLGALVEGADGRGLVFQMSLPPKEFEATSSPAIREHMHRFRRAGDDIPRLHREVHG